ncbi:MAG: cation-translocating P-type ATPase [Clostridiales bacterium]|nr:cation-translocating P-type ATPase [Clostridiales bacterium]
MSHTERGNHSETDSNPTRRWEPPREEVPPRRRSTERTGRRSRDREETVRRADIPVVYADPAVGLHADQVRERSKGGYRNEEVESNSKSLKDIVRSNVCTYFNLIFFILSIAVIAVGAWNELTFMVVVLANTVIGIVQEWRSKKTLDGLNLLTNPKANVMRDGILITTSVYNTVRDDIVVFRAGDQIYADAQVVEGECLVNESLLTGEADELHKGQGDRLLSGSFLVSGECYARLTAVGRDSYMSRLTLQARQAKQQPRSEMMRSLNKLVMVIGIAIIPLGIAMAVKEIVILENPIRDGVVSTVASLIGMIPEGLYLLTSVALMAGVLRLAQRKTLVHEMGCIETLARVDVLCVDKTGTITEPKMVVKDLVTLEDANTSEDELRDILADYVFAMQNDNETMAALKRYFNGRHSRRVVTRALPFTSARKYGGVSFARGGSYLLGAPENLLGDRYDDYREDIEEYSRLGCRVLLLAGYEGALDGGELTGAVTPLGLVLLTNKIREEAPATFRYFREQGVAVKVISGDSPVTVSEVALRAEIPNAEQYVDARTLRTDEELAQAAETYTVFGRVTPEQKRKLVQAMHQAGHTVAMTGDGVNDVLALKEADCSVAMASGSQVACQVSHIVLMDSDFSAMPSVVAEGRRVINNIERSASLYLVKNIFSLCLAAISLIFTFTYPFSASQMSLVSAITIGLPSFVLAMEPNHSRIQGRFLPNVVYRALPSAISDLVLSIGVVMFYTVFELSDAELSTICTLVVAVVGLLMVHRTCKPYNPLRKALMVFCVVAFAFCVLFLRPIFSLDLSIMSDGAWLVLVVFVLLAFEVSLSANVMVDGIRTAVYWVRDKVLWLLRSAGFLAEEK